MINPIHSWHWDIKLWIAALISSNPPLNLAFFLRQLLPKTHKSTAWQTLEKAKVGMPWFAPSTKAHKQALRALQGIRGALLVIPARAA